MLLLGDVVGSLRTTYLRDRATHHSWRLGLDLSRLDDPHCSFTLAQYEARELGLCQMHRLPSVLGEPVAHVWAGQRAPDVLHKVVNNAARSARAHPYSIPNREGESGKARL